MITTVTLNPAIDKTATTDSITPGQVNRLIAMTEYAGGKGINVTRVVTQYKENVTAIGFLGGYQGKFIQKEVERWGAKCQFTQIAGVTRTNFNIIGKDGYVTEILEPGPTITEREQVKFLDQYRECIIKSDVIVLSGSLPNGVKDNFYREMISIANQKDKRVILDTSKEALKVGVTALPYMIKPNVKEMEYLVGRKLSSIEQLVEAALEIRRLGIAKVIISMGEKGLLYVDAKQRIHAIAPRQRATNTVGCGDTVVASFAMSIEQGDADEVAIKKAVARSAANATTMENGFFSKSLENQLFEQVKLFKK